MSKNDIVSNAAHPDGYTCLTFSPNGRYAYTGGTDYLVRIWSMAEHGTEEPDTAIDAEQDITSLAAADDFWLSASDDLVRRYTGHDTQLDGFVTNANGVRIRSVSIDPKGKRIAVASDELFVKVIDVEDTSVIRKLEGHTKGVRQVSWDPSGSFLTSIGSDGKLIIWNMSNEEPKLEKTIEDIVPAVADQESKEFLHDCSAVWHSSGQHFYVVSRTHEIVTINKPDWTKGDTFTDKDIPGVVSALALSPNGVYLASACQSNIYIWSTQTRRVVTRHLGQTGPIITSLGWCPAQNLLAWTDTNGEFFRWQKPITDQFPDPVKTGASTRNALSTASKPQAGLDLFAENSTSVTPAGEGALDEGDGDVNLDAEEDYDNWIVDDLQGGMVDEPPKQTGDSFVKEMVSITKAQSPFQPGSTPMENNRCFLAYNLIGVIEVTDQISHHIINVDFFDRSTRKSFHFTDTFKSNLGYLGERAVIFASPPEADHPAQILFKPYGSWTVQKEWTYKLKKKDTKILGITVGGLPPSSSLRQGSDSDLQGYGDVVIATTEGDLTFLSGTGRERRIVGLGGDFVSMVAGSEWVFVVYRAGSTTIDGSQNLSYCMINFDDFSVRQRDILPLRKGHTLKWIGLTDQGAPATYDTTGCVHVLTKYRIPHHASWARILDTNLLERRQGKDESYWPVGVSENTFHCLILKGRQEHPGFPRPLIQELSLQLPFRREDPKEELVERQLLYVQTALDCLDEELTTEDIVTRERAIDKEFILLIQAACKSDNIARAIELAKLLHHIQSLDAAIKIANFYHLIGLQEKLETLKREREEAEDRLIIARNKRRKWLRTEAAPREVATNGASLGKRYDPLGDTRPPPAVERPGMSRVIVPVVERTRFSSTAPQPQSQVETQSTTRSPSPVAFTTDLDEDLMPQSSMILNKIDNKRKRTEIEDTSHTQSSDISVMPPPPKQKVNPFARKPNHDATSRNPFASHKPDVNNNNSVTKNSANGRGGAVHKSDSFFDKVEAAESESVSSKRGGKKGSLKSKDKSGGSSGGRQTTLFGMIPRAFQTSEKPAKPTKSGNEVESSTNEDADIQMSDTCMAPNEDSLTDLTSSLGNEFEDQDATDSQLVAMDGRGLEETQLVEEESQGWE